MNGHVSIPTKSPWQLNAFALALGSFGVGAELRGMLDKAHYLKVGAQRLLRPYGSRR